MFGKKPGYKDVAGLCAVKTRQQLEAQGCSLNPGRHIGVAPGEGLSDEDFLERFELLSEEFQSLTERSHELEGAIAVSVTEILAE